MAGYGSLLDLNGPTSRVCHSDFERGDVRSVLEKPSRPCARRIHTDCPVAPPLLDNGETAGPNNIDRRTETRAERIESVKRLHPGKSPRRGRQDGTGKFRLRAR